MKNTAIALCAMLLSGSAALAADTGSAVKTVAPVSKVSASMTNKKKKPAKLSITGNAASITNKKKK